MGALAVVILRLALDWGDAEMASGGVKKCLKRLM